MLCVTHRVHTVEYGGGGAECQEELVSAGAAGRAGVQLSRLSADDRDEDQPQQTLRGLQQTVAATRHRAEQNLLCGGAYTGQIR